MAASEQAAPGFNFSGNIMKRLKILIKAIIFTSLMALVLLGTNKILEYKDYVGNNDWPTTATYRQFYRMKKDSIDVLFLGSSVCVNCFNPQILYDEYGIRSYNLGSEQQSVLLSRYWLEEALRSQSPKTVVLETQFLFPRHAETPVNTQESFVRKCLDPMHYSSVKAAAINEVCSLDPAQTTLQSKLSYYLTNLRYHDRWENMTEADFTPGLVSHEELKGYSALLNLPAKTDTYTPFVPSDSEALEAMMPQMQDSLVKISSLCRERGIQLILVSVPTVDKMSDGVNNTLKQFAAQEGIPYFNFASEEWYAQLGADPSTDICTDHANIWGSAKISRLMGSILSGSISNAATIVPDAAVDVSGATAADTDAATIVPDAAVDVSGVTVANTDAEAIISDAATVIPVPSVQDSQWDDTDAYYQHLLKKAELLRIQDVDEYLDALVGEDYSVLISVLDDAAGGIRPSTAARLQAMGCTFDLSQLPYCSYYAVIQPGDVIQENASGTEVIAFSGRIDHRTVPYVISSGGRNAGDNTSILIAGKEQSMALPGLNIVVYDNELNRVADSVNFSTNSPDAQEAVRKRDLQ